MILDKIKAYGFMVLSGLLLVLLAVQTMRLASAEIDYEKLNNTLITERALAVKAVADRLEANRTTELDLMGYVANTRKDVTNEVTITTNERDALLKRVRNAEAKARAATVSQVGPATCAREAPPSDLGTEVLATLGEEDVEEANRADTIRVHLIACYKQYDAAREALAK